jgi:hypothetical protein
MLAQIAGQIALGLGSGFMRRKALRTLINRGVLPAGANLKQLGTKNLLEGIAEKGMNPTELAKRAFRSSPRGSWINAGRGGAAAGTRYQRMSGFGKFGRLGEMARTGGAAGLGFAEKAGAQAFQEAAGQMMASRAFGFGEKALLAGMGFGLGWELFSELDRFSEKNIPAPVQEILQTQQMFLPRQAYTQRQRAIQAIHQSGVTTRSALGNEASYMHG